MSAPYQYGKLPQDQKAFRLLKLQTQPDGTPRVDLVAHLLSSAPEYVAVSYTWGDSELSHSITIGAASELRVTSTVHEMLYALRPGVDSNEATTLHLWIDFVCINQGDAYEKDHQIPLMRDIYAGATEVLCYLGQAADAHLAHEFAPMLLAFFQYATVTHSAMHLLGLDTRSGEMFNRIANPFERHPDGMVAFQGLLANRYWTRAWIIQEVISGHRVRLRYGDSYMEWDVLGTIVEMYCTHTGGNDLLLNALSPETSAAVLRAINCVDNLRTIKRLLAEGPPPPLQDVIMLSCQSSATEPQDKVVAVLGLSRDADHPHLQPDHRLSPGQVFTRTTLHCLAQGNFSLLNLAGAFHHAEMGSRLALPSWVPDLSRPPLRWPMDNPQSLYQAGGLPCGAEVARGVDNNSSTLRVRGYVVGCIAAVSPGLTPLTELTSIDDYSPLLGLLRPDEEGRGAAQMSDLLADFYFNLWALAVSRVPDPYPASMSPHHHAADADHVEPEPSPPPAGRVSRHEAFWRTLVGDEGVSPQGIVHPAPDEVGGYFASFRKWCRISRRLRDAGSSSIVGGSVHVEGGGSSSALDRAVVRELSIEDHFGNSQFCAIIGKKSFGRRLAVTEAGHMGLVSAGVRPGDVVCVFRGSKTPYILRGGGDGGDGTYTLLCEAYLHGFMSGEALVGGFEARWFSLA